jgi:cyclophilin family peptidyl-prolyl cis-trans isomerase
VLGTSAGKPEDLRPVLADAAATPSELAEAIRALHKQGPEGDAEIAAFATRNAPASSGDPAGAAWAGPRFGAIRVALELLGERVPTPTITTSLKAFLPKGATPIASSATPVVARRLATLRCLAAAALHAGAPGEGALVKCAAHEAGMPGALATELDAIRDDARLTAIDRGDVTGERRELLLKLASSSALRVRERALAVLAKHAEAEETPDLVVKALSAKELGLVASVALALADRPSIGAGKDGKSKKQIEEGLDPKAPGPVVDDPEKKGLDARVRKALDGALARPLEDADAEIKIDLAAAVGALQYAKGRAFVMRLCADRGPALRRAARLALDRLDPPGSVHACDVVADLGTASPLAEKAPAVRTLRLDTEAGAVGLGTLSIALDPLVAPIAVARVAELASSGFYDGLVFHRVVPGFVVQLGDPFADGYGGAQTSLRCETAPVPFGPLDVGVALAGRDTGSSQIFVTLARTPHLDGSYAWLGHAKGAWDAIAEGDVIKKISVE